MVEDKKKEVAGKEAAEAKFDPYEIIRYPLSTEKSIRQIEFDNKLVFAVHPRATKRAPPRLSLRVPQGRPEGWRLPQGMENRLQGKRPRRNPSTRLAKVCSP